MSHKGIVIDATRMRNTNIYIPMYHHNVASVMDGVDESMYSDDEELQETFDQCRSSFQESVEGLDTECHHPTSNFFLPKCNICLSH